jgi:hypothetical protein
MTFACGESGTADDARISDIQRHPKAQRHMDDPRFEIQEVDLPLANSC